MTSAQVVETSVTVTDNSPYQDYPHPDDHTTRSTVTPGFKPFTACEPWNIYRIDKNLQVLQHGAALLSILSAIIIILPTGFSHFSPITYENNISGKKTLHSIVVQENMNYVAYRTYHNFISQLNNIYLV